MRNFILLLTTLLITITLPSQTTAGSFPETQPHESFVLLENDTVGIKNRKLVAKINLKSINYDAVLKMAEEEARRLGGNCLIITDHKKPGIWANKHRIKADILRIDNPEAFEQEVLWHPLRPLKVCNFRGSKKDNPLPSASNSVITINLISAPESGKTVAIIEAKFKSEESFMIPSAVSDKRLAYEQLIFDLTEVYARKMRKIIEEEITSAMQLLEVWPTKIGGLLAIWHGKRTEMLMEMDKDSTAQEKWREWVHTELDKLQNYAQTDILLAGN